MDNVTNHILVKSFYMIIIMIIIIILLLLLANDRTISCDIFKIY